jgi:hypothetical protein
VSCGYTGQSNLVKYEKTNSGTSTATDGVNFKEKRGSASINVSKNIGNSSLTDVGVINLDKPITSIIPMPLAKGGFYDFFEKEKSNGWNVFKKNAECKIEGYGINAQGTSGILYSGAFSNTISLSNSGYLIEMLKIKKNGLKADSKKLAELDNCIETFNANPGPKNIIPLIKILNSLKAVKMAKTFGDSGGPLICRKDKNFPWQILATNSKGGKFDEGKKTKTIYSRGFWHLLSKEDWDEFLK